MHMSTSCKPDAMLDKERLEESSKVFALFVRRVHLAEQRDSDDHQIKSAFTAVGLPLDCTWGGEQIRQSTASHSC